MLTQRKLYVILVSEDDTKEENFMQLYGFTEEEARELRNWVESEGNIEKIGSYYHLRLNDEVKRFKTLKEAKAYLKGKGITKTVYKAGWGKEVKVIIL